MITKNIILQILSLFLIFPSLAQIHDPVQWKFESKKKEKDKVVLMFSAEIEPDWHIYSQFIPDGGPLPTTFSIEKNSAFDLVGTMEEKGELIRGYDQAFSMNISWFERKAVFIQEIKLNKASPCVVSGTLEYMACNDMQCLPPEEVEFSISVETKRTPEINPQN